MLTEIAAIVLPILLCASIGVIWARSGTPYDTVFVTRVVMNIGMPCLIISSLDRMDIEVAQFAEILLVAMTICFMMGGLALVFIRLRGEDFRTYLPAMMFSNIGNMGLPLCFFAFGAQGLALGMGFFITLSLISMIFAIPLIYHTTGGIKGRVMELARQPIIYAIVLSLLLLATDSKLPLWIANSVNLLGGLSIPLMLLTLGVSLAGLRVDAWKRGLSYATLRVGGGFLLALVAVELFDLKGAARGVTLIQASMPAAVTNYLLAQRYGRGPEEVAGVVVLSTLLAFLLLPFLLGFVLSG